MNDCELLRMIKKAMNTQTNNYSQTRDHFNQGKIKMQSLMRKTELN